MSTTMKTIRHFLAILAAILIPACTATQLATAQADTQQIATVIRQAEGWFPTPANFNLYFELTTKQIPAAVANTALIEKEYADLYAKGGLTISALEKLASIYDAK